MDFVRSLVLEVPQRDEESVQLERSDFLRNPNFSSLFKERRSRLKLSGAQLIIRLLTYLHICVILHEFLFKETPYSCVVLKRQYCGELCISGFFQSGDMYLLGSLYTF